MPTSIWSRIARWTLLLLILAGTAWAFSARLEQRLTAKNAGSAITDETGSLTPEERSRLHALSEQYTTDFAIRLRVRISNTDIRPPHRDHQSLFLGLSPKGNEVLFVLPRLMEQTLPGAALQEEEKNLRACLQREPTGACLEKTLSALRAYLQDTERSGLRRQENGRR
ncbi:MAG: hypothetical protein LBC10_02185 [Deltaproteobacteria bacterium]|nr:hypothetical protein [Deltaproteobacteria bacterium]